MKTKSILIRTRAAAKVLELWEKHDLPINITKGHNYKTNDHEGTVLSWLTIEYEEKDELLVDWLVKNAEE